MVLAKIVQFRRGRKNYTPRHMLIQLENVSTREEAMNFVGKKVEWISKSGKKIRGEIVAPHGKKGIVRAIFEKGLPGQSLGEEVKII
ncbi:MAG: 50S ribosomal protein L35ae [Candidatus Pacearchaeota archaeon]